MDLLEIRKKAREKKEAEAAARAAGVENAQAQEPLPEAAPETVPETAPVKKKRAKAKPKPEPEAEPAPVAVPETEPLLEEALPEGLVPVELPGPVTSDDDDGWLIDEGEDLLLDESAFSGMPEDATPPPAPPEKPQGPPPATPGGDTVMAGFHGEDATAAEDDIIEYLAFRIADEEYAVKVSDVKEIIRLQRTTRVPRAQEFVEGIISLRGVIIPVFDIKKKLGFKDDGRGRSARIVILSEDGNPQGIIVDRVTGVARLRKGDIEPPPSVICGVEAEYIEGLGRINGKLLILFNTYKILSMEG